MAERKAGTSLLDAAPLLAALRGESAAAIAALLQEALAEWNGEHPDRHLALKGILARQAGLSTAHFGETFSALTGLPPMRFLLQARMRRVGRRRPGRTGNFRRPAR